MNKMPMWSKLLLIVLVISSALQWAVIAMLWQAAMAFATDTTDHEFTKEIGQLLRQHINTPH